jgi:protein-S-isoprenylcysteine O-methyltransferase Ste14
MISLYLRNLFFTILQPGIVVVLIPYLLLKQHFTEGGDFMQIAGSFVGFFGLIVMLACIKRFVTEGKGTLSPADPTKQLVINGLYRHSRNPMYVGVVTILIGESLFFSSSMLGIYTLVVFIVFNLFIIFMEEPRLKRDFGEAYIMYCKNVRRWI